MEKASVMVCTSRKRKNVAETWFYPPVVDWIPAVALKNDSELAVDCKKWAGFKRTKCLEKSGICHHREVIFIGRSSYDILIKHYKKMKN